MTDKQYAKLLLEGDTEAILRKSLSDALKKHVDNMIAYNTRKDRFNLTLKISDALHDVLEDTNIDTNFDDVDVENDKVSFTVRILNEHRLVDKEISIEYNPKEEDT